MPQAHTGVHTHTAPSEGLRSTRCPPRSPGRPGAAGFSRCGCTTGQGTPPPQCQSPVPRRVPRFCSLPSSNPNSGLLLLRAQLLVPVSYSVSLGKSLPLLRALAEGQNWGLHPRVCTRELLCWELGTQYVPCPHQPSGLWDIALLAPQGSMGVAPPQRPPALWP